MKVKSLSSVRLFATPWTRLLCPWDSPGKNTGVDCLQEALGFPASPVGKVVKAYTKIEMRSVSFLFLCHIIGFIWTWPHIGEPKVIWRIGHAEIHCSGLSPSGIQLYSTDILGHILARALSFKININHFQVAFCVVCWLLTLCSVILLFFIWIPSIALDRGQSFHISFLSGKRRVWDRRNILMQV